jgi:hypothetical protein
MFKKAVSLTLAFTLVFAFVPMSLRAQENASDGQANRRPGAENIQVTSFSWDGEVFTSTQLHLPSGVSYDLSADFSSKTFHIEMAKEGFQGFIMAQSTSPTSLNMIVGTGSRLASISFTQTHSSAPSLVIDPGTGANESEFLAIEALFKSEGLFDGAEDLLQYSHQELEVFGPSAAKTFGIQTGRMSQSDGEIRFSDINDIWVIGEEQAVATGLGAICILGGVAIPICVAIIWCDSVSSTSLGKAACLRLIDPAAPGASK